MPARQESVTTIEELLALPDDGLRHELLEGVHVVTPAPILLHQAILREVHSALATALKGHQELELFWSPADIVLGTRSLVQPDLFVVKKETGRRLTSWKEVGVHVLAVEALSPGTAARDRGAKRRIYQRAGVAEYWIVDLDARLVERWRPGDTRPEVVPDELSWEQSGLVTRIHLRELFATVLGEEDRTGGTPAS